MEGHAFSHLLNGSLAWPDPAIRAVLIVGL